MMGFSSAGFDPRVDPAERGVSRGPLSSAEDYYHVLADVQSHEIWDRDIYLRGVFFPHFPRSGDFADGHKDNGYIAAMKY